jgi:hypothetical protein
MVNIYALMKYKTEHHVCETGQLIRIEEIATN